MIEAHPGDTITPVLTDAPTGAALQHGVRIVPAGTYIVALTATGITETVQGGGISNYEGSLDVPADADVDVQTEAVWELDGVIVGVESIDLTPGPPPGVTPSVDDVAAFIRARTTDDNGNQVGTFSDDTRPTADQVESLIEHVTLGLTSRLGTVPTSEEHAARTVAAIGTAMLVELSYFPEQVRAEESAYSELKALYDENLLALMDVLIGEPASGRLVSSVPITTVLADASPVVTELLP